MGKTGKALLALVLAVVIFACVPIGTYAAGESDLDAALRQRGYPQIALDGMEDSVKAQIVTQDEVFAGGVIGYFDEDGNCTEVSIQQDGTYITPRAQISASDLTLVLTYSAKKAGGILDYIRVNLSYTWQKLPVARREDAISISWDDADWEIADNDFHKIDKYAGHYQDLENNLVYVTDQTCSEEYGFANANACGVTWYAKLKGNLGIVPSKLYGSGSFILDAKAAATATGSSKLYAHYAHSTSNAQLTVNIKDKGSVTITGGEGSERAISKSVTW